MTSKELIEIAEKWQKEKEGRTIIVIASEPKKVMQLTKHLLVVADIIYFSPYSHS